MNRRAFIRSATGALLVPAFPAIVRAITPQQRAAVLAARPKAPVVGGGGGSEWLGNTDAGASVLYANNATLTCFVGFTATHTGTVDRVSIYCAVEDANQDIKLGIYADSSGPSSKVGTETEFTNIGTSTAGWKEFTVSYPVTSGSKYWVCRIVSADAQFVHYYDVGAGSLHYYRSGTYAGSFPDPFGTASDNAVKFSGKVRLTW